MAIDWILLDLYVRTVSGYIEKVEKRCDVRVMTEPKPNTDVVMHRLVLPLKPIISRSYRGACKLREFLLAVTEACAK
jgi:hypothetical protein